MLKNKIFIAVALLTACAMPCNAAQKKKDALAEKWAKDKNLAHLLDTQDNIMYVFQGSIKKVVPQAPTLPQHVVRTEKTDGMLHYSIEGLKTTPTERIYTFWTNSLMKPHVRGKMPGIYKNAVSTTTKWEVNCDKSTYQAQKIVYYAANNRVVDNIIGTQPPQEAVPDTPGELIVAIVCAMDIQ